MSITFRKALSLAILSLSLITPALGQDFATTLVNLKTRQ